MKLETIFRDGRAFCTLPALLRSRIKFELHKRELGFCWSVREGWNSGNGYAKCNYTSRAWMAHRLSYFLAHGHIPRLWGTKILLDHLCENRACVRPSHLEPVTTKVNTARGRAVLFRKSA